ncbi:MAG: calcium/sodium antiporter [Actinomycetota bacterium]|nr:calcium/sodium antiporter [Actinomycetota bacterium]
MGLALLAYAADIFVEGAAAIAARLRVSAVVIGAVVIGIGTSVPELLVTGIAAAQGEREMGVGNIVGSNIANLTLVLGGAALVASLRVDSRLLRREVPLSAAAVGLFAAATIGGLTRYEGMILIVGLVAALTVIVRATTRGRGDALSDDVEDYLEAEQPARSTNAIVLVTILGFVGTVGGAQLLVWGASDVGRELGWSDAFIGLTVVAVGTSLPELVTALAAARRGDDELIIGNVLGSNLFNSLAVGGMLALVSPGRIDDMQLAVGGVLLMVAATVFATVLMARRNRVTRAEAVILVAAYAVTMPLLA